MVLDPVDYERLIGKMQNKRGWISSTNAANQVLHEFVEYVNSRYPDNGNTLTLRTTGYIDSIEHENEALRNEVKWNRALPGEY